MPEPVKLSPVEGIKSESCQLRGTISTELAADENHFSHDAVQLLKHHGTYQQDDRDHRGEKNEDGTSKGKSYMFMVRTRVPGGKVSADALLKELDLCDEFGNGTLRITSRQGLQLHGIVKDQLKETIRRINETKLTTLAACGDVERNVMCCPAPHSGNAVRAEMQEMADRIAEHLKPRTTAYYEIWLTDENGEKHDATAFKPVDEPIYGATYLPRKFKTAVALPEDNCVDIYSNDLGFLAIVENGRIAGYNVLVGGGMGTTPSAKKTFPAIAKQMAFVTPDQVLGVAEAVVKVQRDFGNRSDRKVARLKYLIADWGIDAFKAKVEEYYGAQLPPQRPVDVTDVDDHLGWHEQGDGKWFLGINIENGRIKDEGTLRIKTALRAVLRKYGMPTRMTPLQSIILCDINPAKREDINRILADHGIVPAGELSLLRRYSMACVAWPTCGLSITEAERALPGILDEIEVELARYGLSDERVSVHMTGCPNGCARPYTPDIGLVGKAAGEKYTLFLGGNVQGTRLAFLYADFVEGHTIASTLSPLFRYFQTDRLPGEAFGDFCHRKGKDDLVARAAEVAPASK